MEQRAVPSLLGEWMAVFERVKKMWKLYTLKPVEQAQAEAENPEKFRTYKQPKVPKSEMTKNTPKDRIKLAKEIAEQKAAKEGPDEKAEREKRKAEKLEAFAEERRLAAENCESGAWDKIKDRPRQRNEGKWEFSLDEQKDRVILELAVPKFLDTSLLDLDVQPTWVAMAIKGKEFLIHMPGEINTDSAKAERSMGTGALVLTLPFMGAVIKAPELEDRKTKLKSVTQDKFAAYAAQSSAPLSTDLSDAAVGRTLPTVNLNVVEASKAEREAVKQQRQDDLAKAWAGPSRKARAKEKEVSPNFVDNDDVPPLE